MKIKNAKVAKEGLLLWIEGWISYLILRDGTKCKKLDTALISCVLIFTLNIYIYPFDGCFFFKTIQFQNMNYNSITQQKKIRNIIIGFAIHLIIA